MSEDIHSYSEEELKEELRFRDLVNNPNAHAKRLFEKTGYKNPDLRSFLIAYDEAWEEVHGEDS